MGFFTSDYREFMQGMSEDVWIETGTLRAESVKRAIEFGFKEIHTIEPNIKWFSWAEEHEPELCKNSCVHRYCDSGERVLPTLLDGLYGRDTVIWLDSHYSGEDDKMLGVKECPLLEELQAIISNADASNILICIDDAMMFNPDFWLRTDAGQDKFNAAQWPSIADIETVLPRTWHCYLRGNCLYYRKQS